MSQSKTVNGTPLPGLFLLMFVGLKLAHIIDWSWWWVVSPLWIAAILYVVIGLIVLTIKLKK